MNGLPAQLRSLGVAFLASAALGPHVRAQAATSMVAAPADANPVYFGAFPQRQRGSPRPYDVSDMLGRREIVVVRPNPSIGLAAIILSRPAIAGERYVAAAEFLNDASPPRSDIMVVPLGGGEPVFSLHGPGPTDTAYSPVWSPNGKKLAFLGLGANNDQRLFIWAPETRKLQSFAAPRFRDFIPLRGSGAQTQSSASPYRLTMSIAWVGDDSVMGVSASGAMEAFGPERLAELDRSWQATWRGDQSVIVWNTDVIASCRPQDALVEISVDTGVTHVLSRGPIEAAAASPQGDRVAVVTAQGMKTLAYQGRKHFARQMGYGNWGEEGAPWKVDIVDTVGAGSIRWLDQVEGPVSILTAPSWSMDGRRLFTVTRKNSLVENGPTQLQTYDVSAGPLKPESFSALNSAELAGDLFLAGEPVPSDFSFPPVESGSDLAKEPRLNLGDVNADQLAKTLATLRPGGVVPRAASVDPDPVRARKILAALGLPDRPAKPAPPVAEAAFDGFSQDNVAVFHADTSEGTFVWAVNPGVKPNLLLKTNEYFADVAKPTVSTVDYTVNGTPRQGLLYLPTSGRTASPPPVVVTAYPGYDAAPKPDLVNPNSSYPWQLRQLLAHGFAVFEVDLRAEAKGGDGSLPDRVMREMTPAIDAIKAQPKVDNSRLGYFGNSYGTVTGLTFAGRSNAFSAMVASAPIADFAAYGLTFTPNLVNQACAPAFVAIMPELQDPKAFMALEGPIDTNITTYQGESPLNSTTHSTTPTLFIHGEFDAFFGADELYDVLAERGIPASLAVYRAEPHNIASPGNVLDYSDRMMAWFDKYLMKPAAAPEAP